MRCSNCGTENNNGEKFCTNCGKKLSKQTVRPDNKAKLTSNKKERKRKIKSIFVILISLIGIIGLTTVILLLDYFNFIGFGICKNVGLKSSGTFNLYSSSRYLFVSENSQFLTFYCDPPKGCVAKLTGDYSADFVDDGQTEISGDIKKSDGIYTVNIPVEEASSKTIEFYSIAKDGLKYYESNHIKIDIIESRSDDEEKSIEEVDVSIQELLSQDNYKKSNFNDKVRSVEQILERLSADENPLIKKDSIFFDEESSLYSFTYINGDLGGVKIDDISKDNEFICGESFTENEVSSQNNSNSNVNCDALIMYDWYTNNEDILSIYQNYQRAWNDKGVSTNLTQNPTVNQYATQLANNNLILIASHGSRWSLKAAWFSSPVKYSVICTHEACSKELDKQYQNDISQKNIVRANTEDGQFYWILPSFFTSHYNNGELDNTILLMDNCNGMGSDGDIDFDLGSSMTGKNSAAIGFHNSVSIFRAFDRKDDTYYALGYGTNYLESMADYLMSGFTFSEAYGKTEKIYGTNQKQYFDYYWNSGNQDDENVFPVISGNGNVKLSIQNQEIKEFQMANQLLSINSRYIVSDKNAIYLRDCIAERGRKIADKKNTGQLLSDGETVYFTVSNGYNQSNGHEQYDVFKTDIYGNNPEKVFSGNYESNLVACDGKAIYYIDEEIPEQGNVTYLATLMKYDIASGKKEVAADNIPAAAACYFNGKIYCSNALLGVNLINGTSVYSYDTATGKTEEVARNSTMSKPMYIRTKDRLYFHSFHYEDNKMTNQFLYYITKDGKLEKTAQFPDGYILISVCEDNQTAILRRINQNNTYDNYTFDLNSGKIRTINSGVGYLYLANNDAKANNTFLVGYSVNGTSNTKSVPVSKLESGKLVDYKVDGQKYVSVYNFDYWIEDGFWVDEDMDCHILSRQ